MKYRKWFFEKYKLQLISAMVIAIAILALSFSLDKSEANEYLLVMNILPALPGFLALLVMASAYPKMDETQRAIHDFAFRIGFMLSIVLLIIVGLLQTFVEIPIAPWSLAAASMTGMWGVGLIVSYKKYRG